MSQKTIKVGVVDSGFSPAQQALVQDSAAFIIADGQLWQSEADWDQLGHGSHVISTIYASAPEARFYVAQVFHDRLSTTAVQVAAAIDWLVEQNVDVINLSLGLRSDQDSLKSAVARAIKQGIVLCAASPAKGDPVYPAAYFGVFRMTGDARCTAQQWSYLETAYADFGAEVKSADGQQAGSSMGCARMTGHICHYLAQHEATAAKPVASILAIRQYLQQNAHYFGAEHRG
ncbi:Subtilase family protein [Oceanospirillum multiglobuliferum]|uniref:Peptidase S8/S53 subtilisin kexin sedolisin n=1 Tax=Oceanospirillum multiglobuliferum TaxID=64969 RepID=A0A1T4P345_9GAMM|nr:S8 family serine peptidase [Oceanospirillum multiglobuliferum]OPX55119.1 peptidase S8/S53 subtilisin kexin sedolisin [Oceanospirillum multiglobuliferum]SJZ85933.1 Subtilase family protein [Oceanospirillum multiglobuliferum]